MCSTSRTVRITGVFLIFAATLLGGCAGTGTVRESQQPQPKVSPQVEARYKQGLSALKRQKYRQAIAVFNSVIASEPGISGPHANLGITYTRLKQYEKAEASFRKAVELNPQNAATHSEMGIMYRNWGKFDEAEKAYKRAIEADPGYANAHLNLGILYDLYLLKAEKALPHFQKYNDLEGNDKQVEKWIVELKRRIERNEKLAGK